MDRKQTSLLLLSIFLSISISTALQYQTFSKPAQHKYSEPEPDYINNNSSSLSLELMHRDDDSNYLSPETLLSLRLQRDLLRVQSLSAATQSDSISGPVYSGLSLGSGEYFALLGVGTPASYLYMALDTGSDVVWLQCTPCVSCYTQSGPIFNPTSSSSFRPVPCGSNLCQQLIDPGCDAQERCTYYVPYDDGSFTNGDLSTETFTFVGTTVSNVSLGCGHDNEGLFNGSAGLLGLGRGNLSFPVQTRDRFGGIFSYCLVDRNSSSKSSILFGESAVPPNAVFTPLLRDTLYYVTLTGISVGGHLVPGVNSSVFESQGADGGVIIDSGTTITRLAEPAYDALRDAFQAEVTGLNHTSGVLTFDTCYEPPGAGANVTVPTVTLHFDGGADMRLPAENYLVRADADGKLCLAFASTTSGLSIIGNFQQQGFRVVYDLAANRVGFAPDSC